MAPALISTATSQIHPRSWQLAAISNQVSPQPENSLASLLGYRQALYILLVAYQQLAVSKR